MQEGFQFSGPAEPARLRFLGGLDPVLPSFPRLAAGRIAALDTAKAIEAALAEIPREALRVIETLTITGLALRIAQAQDPRIRELLLNEVPEALALRVEPLAKSYALVKPWTRRRDE